MLVGKIRFQLSVDVGQTELPTQKENKMFPRGRYLSKCGLKINQREGKFRLKNWSCFGLTTLEQLAKEGWGRTVASPWKLSSAIGEWSDLVYMAISSMACAQSRQENTSHRWWATAVTRSVVTPQKAPTAAKVLEVLAATVEMVRWFMITDYAGSWIKFPL